MRAEYVDSVENRASATSHSSSGSACAVRRPRRLHLGLRIEHAKIAFGTSRGESARRPNSTAARRNSGERIARGILGELTISKQTVILECAVGVDTSPAAGRESKSVGRPSTLPYRWPV